MIVSTLRANALALAAETGIPAHRRAAFADDMEAIAAKIVSLINAGMSATEAATEVARMLGVKVPPRAE
jgi:hypothetical protein